MRYTVEYTPRAVEDLKKLTPQAANLVYSWTEKNLVDCQDPRAQGSGRKRGGRWRYRIGAYRLVCEIEEARIVVLAVTSGVEDPSGTYDRRGRAKRRAPSVFLKSTARQPVKAAALLIVTALLTFAFVSRGAEWLLLTQEAERLEGFYRATGGVQETGVKYPDSQNQDTSALLACLEGSPYVKQVDIRQSVAAVLPDVPNDGRAAVTTYLPMKATHYYFEDVFFYGTLQSVVKTNNSMGHLEGDYKFNFLVDQVLVGTDLGDVYMIREGALISLINPQDYRYTSYILTDDGQDIAGTEEHECLEYVDLTEVAQGMEAGGRYLLRGTLAVGKPGIGGGRIIEANGQEIKQSPVLEFKPLTENGPWYCPVAPGEEADFNAPALTGLTEEMELYDENQHAARIYLTNGMERTTAAWSLMEPHLINGRWITEEDVALKRPVCMVYGAGDDSDAFHVGDTITMTLRDLHNKGYFDSNGSTAYRQGLLYLEEDLVRRQEIRDTSVTIDVEVVGVYGILNERQFVPGSVDLYIPSTLVPETFTCPGERTVAHMISYELTGPDVQEAFLAETGADMAALGFQPVMPESGWANFKEAAEPMKQSSLYNALVFALVLAAGLAIVTVVYFYMRRKELPIARAMGVPAKTCVRQVVTPVLLLAGVPGIALGALLGWWWTARNAGETLSALAEFGTIDPAALPRTYLAAMAGLALALLAGMCLLSAVLTARRPVLELLQGAARAAVKEVAAGTAEPSPFAVPQPEAAAVHVRPAAVRREKPGLRAGLTFRFVWRQAARARLKTALTILLAAGFTIGLAAIQLAIAGSQDRVDWLYEHTPVEAELVRTGTYRGASIRRSTAEALKDSGYISDFYLEASPISGSGCAPYSGDWNTGGVHLGRGESSRIPFLAIEDERAFLSGAGSGAGVAVTYHEGWNGALFAQEWTGDYDPADSDTLFPVVVPKNVYDLYELGPGDKLLVYSYTVRPFAVAGYYEGAVNSDHPAPLLLPMTAGQTLCGGKLSYTKAHVTLDPSLNRQLDQFEAVVTEIAGRQDTATLRVVIWDEELRQAVAPLEGSIQLMRALYPVTLVLSLLCAAGGAALFIMTSAKEAAILRVQGTTKLRTQVILGLQQAVACSVGLAAGLTGVLLYVGSARPTMLGGVAASSGLCALGYLAAAVIGSVSSASVVTGRHPLEMLQVKE